MGWLLVVKCFRKKSLLIFSCCLLSLAISAPHSPALAETKQSASDNTSPKPCSEVIYVRMGEHLFAVPRGGTHNFRDGKLVYYGRCDKNKNLAVKADKMALNRVFIPLPGYSEKLRLQLQLDLKPWTGRNWLAEATEELKELGLTIDDLPRDGGVYKYPDSAKNSLIDYIGADEVLTEPDGSPLVFRSCNALKMGPLFCRTSFVWKENIYVLIRPRDVPPDVTMEAWKDLYPRILQYLESIEISEKETSEQKVLP